MRLYAVLISNFAIFMLIYCNLADVVPDMTWNFGLEAGGTTCSCEVLSCWLLGLLTAIRERSCWAGSRPKSMKTYESTWKHIKHMKTYEISVWKLLKHHFSQTSLLLLSNLETVNGSVLEPASHWKFGSEAVSNFASLTMFEGVLAVALHLLLHQVPCTAKHYLPRPYRSKYPTRDQTIEIYRDVELVELSRCWWAPLLLCSFALVRCSFTRNYCMGLSAAPPIWTAGGTAMWA